MKRVKKTDIHALAHDGLGAGSEIERLFLIERTAQTYRKNGFFS